MPGMFAHSGELFGTACDARDRAINVVRDNPNTWPSDVTVVIILAAATTEAFINELAETIAINRDDIRPISPALHAFAHALQEIEDAHGNLQLKYLVASQTLSGSMFEKGKPPYQDFSTLITLRNDIMHMKPRLDTFIHSKGGYTSINPPKYIRNLQQRGLARTAQQSAGMSWFNIIHTPEMGIWACDAAHNIILAVLDFIPDNPIPGLDPSGMFKMSFRNQHLLDNNRHRAKGAR